MPNWPHNQHTRHNQCLAQKEPSRAQRQTPLRLHVLQLSRKLPNTLNRSNRAHKRVHRWVLVLTSQLSHWRAILHKIICRELIGISLQFMSNLTYLGFALCRLSLIDTEETNGKLVELVSKKLSLKVIMSIITILSVLFSIVKYFRFTINSTDLFLFITTIDTNNDYPLRLTTLNSYRGSSSAVFLAFNCLCDLCNYPLHLAVSLGVDIYTVVKLKRTLAKKMATATSEKQMKEDDPVVRAIRMVVLNALVNVFLKLPVTINTFVEIHMSLVYFNVFLSSFQFKENYQTTSSLIYFCQELNGCELFESVSNMLYMLSLTLGLLFYYNFDKNFKSSFRRLMFNEEPAKKKKQPQSKQDCSNKTAAVNTRTKAIVRSHVTALKKQVK